MSATAGVLSRSIADFLAPEGTDLLGRTRAFSDWLDALGVVGALPYLRSLHGPPGPIAAVADSEGHVVTGLNLASGDYLSLADHPAIREAVCREVREFGVHNASAAVLLGETDSSEQLAAELAGFLGVEHAFLFGSGWAAGFAAIAGLVRNRDHVVLDRLSHACLQQGALAATRNIAHYEHLDFDGLRDALRAIRSRDSRGGVLVVTEGLFSVNSDAPRIELLQQTCHEFDSTLLVDVAHDLGALGPGGSGQLGIQGMLGRVDLVVGSFSKTFASNGGFVAADSLPALRFIRAFGSSGTYTNALSPLQVAAIREALRIVRSEEGEQLRHRLSDNVRVLRMALAEHGLECMGEPSPVVPVCVGDDRVARVASGLLHPRGLHTNLFEFPAVPLGSARFRLLVTAAHTEQHMREGASLLATTITDAISASPVDDDK